MRIDYMKLENMVGVMAGMGKEVVEIDFTKGRNNKILLVGNNGQGKSLLLTSASPYRETNDGRRVIPLEGKTAYKEIHYTYQGDKYIIKHYYGDTSAKNKSYVSKNGKELNENGNIRPFNETIEKELDISTDYFTVGRLGSNVANFIDYTTAERKRYINKFIPNIDEYMEAFDTVNTKLNDLNKRLRSINVRLEKYRTLDEIEKSKKELEELITTINNRMTRNSTEIEKENKIIANNQKRLGEIQNELNEKGLEVEDVSQLVELVNSSRELLDQYQNEVESLEKRFPRLFEEGVTLQDLRDRIPSHNTKVEVNSNKLETNKNLIVTNNYSIRELEGEITTRETRINSFNEENVEDLEKELKGFNDKKLSIEREITKTKEKHNDFDKLKGNLSREDVRSHIESVVNTLQDRYSTYLDDKTEADDIMLERYGFNMETSNAKLREYEVETNKLEVEGQELNDTLNRIQKSSGLLDILDQSIHHEHRDDCPFVPMALDFKEGEYTSINEINDRLDEIEDDLKYFQGEIDDIKGFHHSLQRFDRGILSLYKQEADYLGVLDITEEDIQGLFNRSFIHVEQKATPLRVFKEYNLLINELSDIETKIDSIEEKITYNKSFQETINEYQSDIENNRGRILKFEEENLKMSEENEELQHEIERSSNTIKVLNMVIGKVESRDNQKDIVEVYDQYREETNKLNEEVVNATNSLNELDQNNISSGGDLKIQRENLDTINREYYVVESSLKELDNINEVLGYFEDIKNALDIKKGIPLIFTNTYLIDIAERTNELLSIAYDDAFSIDFEVTKRDFNIIVNKSDGTSLDDIALASQGETSMTNTSLSLAMMVNVTSGYNILYLDEVDATLDDNNRRSFLSVLNKQIENLGSEQAFIISHNNEFYSADVDLILLNGHESKLDINDDVIMSNKTVLYKN